MKSPGEIAFTIGNIDIRWYGILIACGALLALYISYTRAPKHGLRSEDVLDLALFMLPIGIIGARIYYVVFSWDYYSNYPLEIFDMRGGGLAIHGGLLLGAFTGYLVCKYKRISFLKMSDLIFPAVALAQAIGRWGNFFNSEAHGAHTNLPWAIIVNGDHVHPTFLYESIWCLIIFFILSSLYKKEHFEGQILCLYGILYSIERLIVEGLRTDSLMLGFLRQAQLISIAILIISVILYIFLKRRNKKQGL